MDSKPNSMKQEMPNQKPSSTARILVAGYGAIGRQMVTQAPKCQWVSLNRSTDSNIKHHLSADLLDLNLSFPQQCPDFLVYTATPDHRVEEAYQKTYVEGLKSLLNWAKGKPIRHIFFVSSTSVYGQNQGEVVDEGSPAFGASFSGKAIAQGETLLKDAGFNYSVVRFGGIYGNGREMLLRHVKKGVEVPKSPAPLTNRIHESDCAGVLLHLMALAEQGESLESVYVGVDDDGSNKAEVYQFIEQELGLANRVSLIDERPANLGKRCLNNRLKGTGYQFIYPSFREGYGELIRGKRNA